MALKFYLFLVYHMKPGFHRFVVCDTFRIVAFHDLDDLIGKHNLFLFHDIEVADVRCD